MACPARSVVGQMQVQVNHSDSDSDCAPSRASKSSAYSALARRGFKKVQQALARRSAGRAKSFTNLVSMLKRDRGSHLEVLTIDNAPHVEQCPEPDYNEGLLVAPESPTIRTFSTGHVLALPRRPLLVKLALARLCCRSCHVPLFPFHWPTQL